MIQKLIRVLCCVALAAALLAGAARAEVYIDQEKPADWEELDLLRIYALYALDCDSFILECGGQVMLLDGGNGPKRGNLVAFLKEHGWEHPDIIFSTHPHDDHLEAVYDALRLGQVSTDVFMSPFEENYWAYGIMDLQRKTARVLIKKEIPFRQVFNGDVLTLGGAEMTVYRYDSDTRKRTGGRIDVNDMSAVLHVRFGECAILLTADISGAIQRLLAQDYGSEKLKAEILKAAHHGKNAVNAELLKAVDPKLVIITGKVARTQDCMRQLNNAGIPWKRTSYGNILMETDGKDWYVTQDYTSDKVKRQELQQRKQK